MRAARVLTSLVLFAGCTDAQADPPPTDVGASPRWRALSPSVRWYEGADVFTDDGGVVRASRLAVARIDLRRTSLEVLRAQSERPDEVAARRDVLLAFNGGFFAPDHRPSGLLASGGALLGEAAYAGGSGVLVVSDGRATLLPREATDGGVPWRRAAVVVQCGPRLVEAGGAVGVYRDDGQRYARTAACIRDGGRTLDLVATWQTDAPLRGPGLYEFSRRLAAPGVLGDGGCEAALNLDGGPSTGVFARDVASRWRYLHEAVGPTPWLIVARR
jgi:uncharacterized protein YigE (DUF2233 family)